MNEHFEQPHNEEREEKPIEMNEFRKEIEEVKERDIETGGPSHLFHVNVAELIEKDAREWEKVKNESVTNEDVEAYRKEFLDEKGFTPEGISKSRVDFFAFVANKASVVLMKKWLAEHANEKIDL